MLLAIKHIRNFLLVLLVVVLVANIYIYLHRDNYSKTYQVGYHDVYPDALSRYIGAYSIDGTKGIHVIFNKEATKNSKWKVTIDSSKTGSILSKPYIEIKEGVHNYFLENTTDKSLSVLINAEFFPESSKPGQVGFGKIVLNSAPQPAPKTVLPSSTTDTNTLEDKAAIQKIVKDSLKLNPNDSTKIKVKKIAEFIAAKIAGTYGNPSDSVCRLSPYNQFIAASKGQKIWCGIYAEIAKAFLIEAGIKNRQVFLRRSPGIAGAMHTANEYFIEEEGYWATLDFTFMNLGFVRQNGKFLNTVQIKNLAKEDSAIKVLHWQNGSFQPIPFWKMPDSIHSFCYNKDMEVAFYFSSDLESQYKFSNKLTRYINGNPIEYIFNENMVYNNYKFYFKEFVIYSGAIIFFLYCFFAALYLFLTKRSLNKF